jgi:hypothetical protein
MHGKWEKQETNGDCECCFRVKHLANFSNIQVRCSYSCICTELLSRLRCGVCYIERSLRDSRTRALRALRRQPPGEGGHCKRILNFNA